MGSPKDRKSERCALERSAVRRRIYTREHASERARTSSRKWQSVCTACTPTSLVRPGQDSNVWSISSPGTGALSCSSSARTTPRQSFWPALAHTPKCEARADSLSCRQLCTAFPASCQLISGIGVFTLPKEVLTLRRGKLHSGCNLVHGRGRHNYVPERSQGNMCHT